MKPNTRMDLVPPYLTRNGAVIYEFSLKETNIKHYQFIGFFVLKRMEFTILTMDDSNINLD